MKCFGAKRTWTTMSGSLAEMNKQPIRTGFVVVEFKDFDYRAQRAAPKSVRSFRFAGRGLYLRQQRTASDCEDHDQFAYKRDKPDGVGDKYTVYPKTKHLFFSRSIRH